MVALAWEVRIHNSMTTRTVIASCFHQRRSAHREALTSLPSSSSSDLPAVLAACMIPCAIAEFWMNAASQCAWCAAPATHSRASRDAWGRARCHRSVWMGSETPACRRCSGVRSRGLSSGHIMKDEDVLETNTGGTSKVYMGKREGRRRRDHSKTKMKNH